MSLVPRPATHKQWGLSFDVSGTAGASTLGCCISDVAFPSFCVWFPNLPVNQIGAGEENAHFSIGLQSPTPMVIFFNRFVKAGQLSQSSGSVYLEWIVLISFPSSSSLCLLTRPFSGSSGGHRGTCVEPVVFIHVVLVPDWVSCFCSLLHTVLLQQGF